LKEYKWKNESRTLEGKIHLIGKFPLTMRLYIPVGYTFSKVDCKGADFSAKQEADNILAIIFKADNTGDYPFVINY
jgi:hypothetical protein